MPTRYHPVMKRTAAVLCLAVLASCAAPESVPDRLGPQALVAVDTGAAACTPIQSLHPESLNPVECVVADYGDARLYLAAYADPDDARRDLLRMAMRLAEGVGGFTPVAFDEGGGGSVFRTTGHGADHLFFRRGRVVAWLQQPTPDPAVERDLLTFGFPAFPTKATD
jgi:hypothetical protein